MPTVLDSLVVTLGLNNSSFREKVDHSIHLTNKMKAALLGIATIAIGGKGIEAFTKEITAADSAAGRFAYKVGLTVSTLTQLQGAAVRAGGSAESMAGTLKGLSDAQQSFQLTGQSGILPWLNFMGIQMRDMNTGKLKDTQQLLLEMARWAEGKDPRRSSFVLAQAGIDEGTINMMLRGEAAMRALIARQNQLGTATAEDARRADQLRTAWLDLTQLGTTFGRQIVNMVSPAITEFLNKITSWVLKNKDWITDVIGEKVRQAIEWIQNVDWDKVWVKALDYAHKFKDVALDIYNAVEKITKLILDFKVPPWLARAFGMSTDPSENEHANPSGDYLRDRIRGAAGRERQNQQENPQSLSDRIKGWWGRVTGTGEDQTKIAKQIYDRLVSKGHTPEQAAGIVSNIQRESSFNPKEVGDGGQAYGLAQWHPDRQADFKAQFGKDIRDSTIDEQVDFIHHELRFGKERAAGDMLQKAKTAKESGDIISQYYERPAKRGAEAEARGAGAEAWLKKITDLSAKPANQPAAPQSPEYQNMLNRLLGKAPIDPNIGTGGGANVQGKLDKISSNDNSTKSHTFNVAKIEINTQATDAKGIANGITGALRNLALSNQANRGLS